MNKRSIVLFLALVAAVCLAGPQLLETASAQFIVNPYRFAASGGWTPPESGSLVAWWEHNSAAPLADSSGNSNVLVLPGGGDDPVYQSDTNGYYYTGGDYLYAADHASLDASTDLTVSFWAKADDASGNEAIFTKWLYATEGAWAVSQIGSSQRTYIAGSLTDSGANRSDTSGGTPFPSGVWVHWVVVYDGGGADNAARLKFYKNGSPYAQSFAGTIPSSLQNAAADVTLGNWAAGSSADWPFSGYIDEGMIWTAALTSDDVVAVYNHQVSDK